MPEEFDDLLAVMSGPPTVQARSLPAGSRISLRGWVRPSHVMIDLLNEQTRARRVAKIRIVPSIRVTTVDSPEASKQWGRHSWAMADSLRGYDVLANLSAWTLRSSLGVDVLPSDDEADARQRTSVELGPIWKGLRSLATAALRLCNQTALRAAQSFDAPIRSTAYRLFCEDSTGRLLQVATCAPGALLFAWSLMVTNNPEAEAIANKLRKDLIAGRQLNSALDEALYPSSPSHQIRLRKRLLIRRAAACVPPELFWFSPPALVPEEIPRHPRANLRWFTVMLTPRLVDRSDADPRYAQLSAFLSRSFAELDASGDVLEAADDIVTCARETDRFPHRSSSLGKVMDEVRRWMAFRHQLLPCDGWLPAGIATRMELLDQPFPDPPFAEERSAAARIEPIRTPMELFKEAGEMRHCAASLYEHVIEGNAFLYRAHVGKERLTVLLRRGDGPWFLIDCRGLANRKPSEEACAVLFRWLAWNPGYGGVSELFSLCQRGRP